MTLRRANEDAPVAAVTQFVARLEKGETEDAVLRAFSAELASEKDKRRAARATTQLAHLLHTRRKEELSRKVMQVLYKSAAAMGIVVDTGGGVAKKKPEPMGVMLPAKQMPNGSLPKGKR